MKLQHFSFEKIIERTKSAQDQVKKELNILEKASILKSRKVSKDVQVQKGKTVITKKIEGLGYYLNTKYPYYGIH